MTSEPVSKANLHWWLNARDWVEYSVILDGYVSFKADEIPYEGYAHITDAGWSFNDEHGGGHTGGCSSWFYLVKNNDE